MPDDEEESAGAGGLVLALVAVSVGIMAMNHMASRPGESWYAKMKQKFGPGFKVSGRDRMPMGTADE